MDEKGNARGRFWSLSKRVRMRSGSLFEGLEQRTFFSTVVWDGGISGLGTDWHNPVNWAGDVLPANGDDVVVNAGTGVQFSAGTLSLLSLSSTRPISVLGGSLSVTAAATVTAQVMLNGGTIGGAWTLPGLSASANPANGLSAATINGDITLADDNAFISVSGGLTVNGLVAMQGDGAVISFNAGIQTFGGNADVQFSGFTGLRSFSADSDALLTLAPTTTFMGERGRITSGLVSGTGSVINQGVIWANTEDGTIKVNPSTFTNVGTLRATSEGTLKIAADDWTNSGTISINDATVGLGGTFNVAAGIGTFNRTGGTVTIDGTILNSGGTLVLNAATGSWQFNGGQIIGGTINLTGGASVDSFPLASGRIAQAVITGSLSWLTSNFTCEFDGVALNGSLNFAGLSTLSIKNGFTLNGTLTISGDDATVQFVDGSQSLLGSASILLRHANSYFWAVTPLTLPASAIISGYGHIYGQITSAAAITSDTAGKALIIAKGDFQSSGLLTVAPGASLSIGDSNSGSSLFTNSGSIVATGNATVMIGPSSSSGPVVFTNTGTLLIDTGAILTVGTQLVFNPITVNNSGTIEVAGGSSMTFGTATAVVAPQLNNTGVIKATGSGLIVILAPATTAQLGDLRAAGGIVRLQSTVDNTAAVLTQNATSGSWEVSGGKIIGGTLSFAPGASLVFDGNIANTLDGVTVQGSWALARAGARLQILNGLILSGTLTLSGSDAAISFNGGLQSVAGTGGIVLAGGGLGQSISADGGAVVTIGASMSISGGGGGGTGGQIRSGYLFGGGGSIVNNGTISGNLTINAASFTNGGIVEAANGTTLRVQGVISNYSAGTLTGGTWRVVGNSTIDFAPGPITSNHAILILDGPKSSCTALSTLASNSGTVRLSGGRNLSLAGSFTNTGTVDLGSTSSLTIHGSFTQSSLGILKLQVAATAHSFVSASTVAMISGAISVVWLSYVPPVGTLILLLKAPTVTGTFSSFQSAGLSPSLAPTLSYGPNSVSLLIAALNATASTKRI